jgi:hypothetical protein
MLTRTILLLLALAPVITPIPAAAAELQRKTIEAWNAYIGEPCGSDHRETDAPECD